jgi:hypothetical protein
VTTGALVGIAGAIASAAWFVQLVRAAIHRKCVRRLADVPPEAPPGGWPRLAVLVAARDEAATIEPALRSLLAQDYPDLVVHAVDDRSTDGTGAILDRLAAENPHLHPDHVAELPAGWLGKTNALQRAADAAIAGGAEWLLLTDADVHFAPGALRRAVAGGIALGADHVCVLPGNPTEFVGERIFLSLFCLGFVFVAPVWRVERRESRAHIGVGAFNLVRAEAFAGIGGFRRLALSVDDDMRLGQALKFAGRQARVFVGGTDVSVRWHAGLGALIGGLEKNVFAWMGFRPGVVAFACLAVVGMNVLPFVGLFVGPGWSRAACAVGVATICAMVGASGGSSGIRFYYGLLLPVAAVLMLWTILRSTYRTLARGGVRWREHLYPLAELRQHVRLRRRWLREVWLSTR